MLLNCASAVRRTNFLAARLQWQCYFHASPAAIRRQTTSVAVVKNDSASPICSPGYVKLSDFLDEVFPSLAAAMLPETKMKNEVATVLKAPRLTVRINDRPPSVEFTRLVGRLHTYRLPRVNVAGEAIVNTQLNAHNAKLLAEVRPSILQLLHDEPDLIDCLRLLNVIALKNVRDEEIAAALYDAIVAYNAPLSLKQLAKVATSYARLGIHHDGALARIYDDLLHVFRDTSVDNTNEVAQIIIALARVRTGSLSHWIAYSDWIRRHYNELAFADRLMVLNAFALLAAPSLVDKWPAVGRVLATRPLDPAFVFSNAYNAATAMALTADLAQRVLDPANLKAYLLVTDDGLSASALYHAWRLWHICAYEAFITGRNVESNFGLCKSINDYVTANKHRTDLFWQVKYSRNLTSVNAFRALLHDIAPLGTHATTPHIHPERGVCIEANLYVHNGQIISVIDAQTAACAGEKPTLVSVLFFLSRHTTTMTDNDKEAVVRLDGRSQLAVQLMRASQCTGSLPRTHPVVFTEQDLDGLVDDEVRCKLIRRRIECLSKHYHYADWPKRKYGKRRKSF